MFMINLVIFISSICAVLIIFYSFNRFLSSTIKNKTKYISDKINESKSDLLRASIKLQNHQEVLQRSINTKDDNLQRNQTFADSYYEIELSKMNNSLDKSKAGLNNYLKEELNIIDKQHTRTVVTKAIENIHNTLLQDTTKKDKERYLNQSIANILKSIENEQ